MTAIQDLTDNHTDTEEEAVCALLTQLVTEREDLADMIDVSSFDEAGVLALNKGLVLRLRDGAEFQIAVVQSRSAR